MKVLAVFVLAHGPFACVGCSSHQTPLDITSALVEGMTVEIALARRSCVREGAEYTVRVAQDGRVNYDGFQNVRAAGRRQAKIPPEAVRTLFETFSTARYVELANSDDACTSDAPCTSISVRVGDAESRLHDCAESSSGAEHLAFHASVSELARAVDEAAHSVRWTQDYSDSMDD